MAKAREALTKAREVPLNPQTAPANLKQEILALESLHLPGVKIEKVLPLA